MRRAPHRLDLFVLGALLLAQHAGAQAPSSGAPPADVPSSGAPPADAPSSGAPLADAPSTAPPSTAAPPVDAPSTAPTSFPAPPQRAKTDEKPPLGVLPTPDDLLMDPRMARSWGALPARLFVATTFDIGFVYLRPRVSFGYGRPFTSWVGVDVNALALSAGIGAYGGLRLEIPHMDWRVGSRYFSSFNRTYLDRQTSYSRLELESSAGDPARTLTLETELDLSVPIGPGSVLARGSMSYVMGVPGDQEVFEETLHVIVDPPLVWRARGGYVFVFGAYHQHAIGLVVDALDVPKRDDSLTVRAGPLVRFVLSRRVEVRGSFVMTITSPDRIGLVGGDFTELGVRYRWASE